MESDGSISEDDTIDDDTADHEGPPAKKRKTFSVAQKAHINAMYEGGMNSSSKKYRPLIEKAAGETGLTVQQVANWIKKKRYRQKHAKAKRKCEPTVRLKVPNPWQVFQKTFGESEAGKAAMANSPGEFCAAASEAYRKLDANDKQSLRDRCGSIEMKPVTVDVRKAAAKIFRKVESQLHQLGELKYKGFAFVFFDDDMLVSYTEGCESCVSHSFLDYMRSIIVAGTGPPSISVSGGAAFTSMAHSSPLVSDQLPSPPSVSAVQSPHSLKTQINLISSPTFVSPSVSPQLELPTQSTKPSKTPKYCPSSIPTKNVSPRLSNISKTITASNTTLSNKLTCFEGCSTSSSASAVSTMLSSILVALAKKFTFPTLSHISSAHTLVTSGTVPKMFTSSRTSSSGSGTHITSGTVPKTFTSSHMSSSAILVTSSSSTLRALTSSEGKENSDFWMAELGLFIEDFEILQRHDWLNDNHIRVAQLILQKEFNEDIGGWQSPQLCKRPELFKMVSVRKPFIQILHVNASHWVVVSNIPFRRGSNNVYIYDSMCPETITDSLVNMTCSFYKSSFDRIIFDVVNVHRQTNFYDCGVFAIAYAAELAHGRDPAKYNWDCTSIRSHLIHCFEKKKIECFPKSGERSIRFGRQILKSRTVHLACICRMPVDESKSMICCGLCKNVFHIVCVSCNITPPKQWICFKCLEILTPPHN